MAILKNELKKNFTIIPNELIVSNLKHSSLRILLLLYSKPSDWKVYQSQIAKELNLDISTVKRSIKELKKLEYLTIKKSPKGNKGFEYEYCLNMGLFYDGGKMQRSWGARSQNYNGCKNEPHTNTNLNKDLLNTNNDKENIGRVDEKIDEVVDYLNLKTKSKFQSKNKNTIKNLKRILEKEKFNVEDVKLAIDFK